MIKDLINRAFPICSFEGKERYADYYCLDNNPNEIFVKFGVPYEIDIHCLFSLLMGWSGNFFVLQISEFIGNEETVDFYWAGYDLDSARRLLIEKVVETTIPNKFEDPLSEVKNTLVGSYLG